MFVFCNDQNSGCVFIYPVNESGPAFTCAEQRQIPEMPHEGINECTGIVSVTGMDYHSRFFVYNNYIVVFIYYIQRDIFWYKLDFPWGSRKYHLDNIPGLDFIIRF